ncbi:MAG: MarR family transcriptional regulator [Lachnospiraceae bacterium]|nr:MarR family transcriptional regulator [Lachnospiraceae bacterium]
MAINQTLNEILVKLFRNINNLEERAIRDGAYENVTVNDVHVMEAIGVNTPKNMSAVAKELSVTTGTLTISVNSLVKKDFVKRIRSEKDRRVVLVSLTEKGKKAYAEHKLFHQKMIEGVIKNLSEEEQKVLETALQDLMDFFQNYQK